MATRSAGLVPALSPPRHEPAVAGQQWRFGHQRGIDGAVQVAIIPEQVIEAFILEGRSNNVRIQATHSHIRNLKIERAKMTC